MTPEPCKGWGRAAPRLLPALILLLALSGCNLLGLNATPIPTPTPTPEPTATFTPSDTPTPTQTPTITPTATITPTPTITLTPSVTFTPTSTPTITPTPYPTVPAAAAPQLAIDRFTRYTLDPAIAGGVTGVWVSFLNINDTAETVTPGTPVAASNRQTVYLASPDGRTRIAVLELPATTGERVFWSPRGNYLAYFLEDGEATGLYTLDLQIGVGIRLFALPTLSQRGIISNPAWGPDNKTLAITLTTAWDTDVFAVGADGTGFRNISNSGGYDFWPVWSPDGAYIAFVSDRESCPTWEPNVPDSCYRPDSPPPSGGALYIYDVAGGAVRKIADQFVTAPPTWIANGRIGFTAGIAGDPLAGTTLYYADVLGGNPVPVTDPNPGQTRILREAWSPDGAQVIYQEAAGETNVILRDVTGAELARLANLTFPRFAFSAAWSPNGQRLALGGQGNQCPFGMIVVDAQLRFILRASSPQPGVCNPVWSPDGRFIAYGGVTGSSGGGDGRYDVYTASPAGVGSRNLSSRLGGQIRLLGWVGE